MDAHWLHGRAGYRCRHGQTTSHRAAADRVPIVYVREDRLIAELTEHLASEGSERCEGLGEIIADLRAANSTIVCTKAGWTLITQATPASNQGMLV